MADELKMIIFKILLNNAFQSVHCKVNSLLTLQFETLNTRIFYNEFA